MANKTIDDFSSIPALAGGDQVLVWDSDGNVTYKVTVDTIGTTFSNVAVPAGGKVYFDGAGGDTYITYESGFFRIYKDGVLVQEW